MNVVPTGFMQFDRFLEGVLAVVRRDQEAHSQQVASTQGAPHVAGTRAGQEEESFTHRVVLHVDRNTSDATPQQRPQSSRMSNNATEQPHLQTFTQTSERDWSTLLRLTTLSSLHQSLLERYLNGDENDDDDDDDVDEEAQNIDWDSGSISAIDADDLLRSSAEDTELSDSVDTLPLYESSVAAAPAGSSPSDLLPPPPYQPLPAAAQTQTPKASRLRWFPFHTHFWKIPRRGETAERVVTTLSNGNDNDLAHPRDGLVHQRSKTHSMSERLTRMFRPRRKKAVTRPSTV